MSVTLCLATLGFLKVYEGTTTRPEVRKAIAELRGPRWVLEAALRRRRLLTLPCDVPDAPR
ncbi:hypothetical protein ACFY3J_36295 [Streptomyces sp. NPDC001231]|uniref:hypothetical protein n=1 Tax=unclassified Streptomyces TaxID=2593676 RepID=UPI0036BDA486